MDWRSPTETRHRYIQPVKRHEFLAQIHARLRPRNYLEIGVNDGRSLRLSRVPTIAIDPARDLVIVYLRNWWGVSSDATDEAVAAVYATLAG